MSRRSIQSLPPEILSHIISYFDSIAPSAAWLHQEPTRSLGNWTGQHRHCDLKSISLVCKLLRFVTLPLLFRHIICRLPCVDLPLRPESDELVRLASFLKCLRRDSLGRQVRSFTLVVGPEHESARYKTATGCSEISCKDNNWFWRTILDAIDPRRFTIVAPPHCLAALFSRSIGLDEAWAFDGPFHILSLSRERTASRKKVSSLLPSQSATPSPASTNGGGSTAPPPVPCDLFTLRPWCAVHLNEGSSISAYKTYEFFLRRTPSILDPLLGAGPAPNHAPLLPASIRDFTFVGIFPLYSHLTTFADALPVLDHFLVHLEPLDPALLDDQAVIANVDRADLWLERDYCVGLLLDAFFRPGNDRWTGRWDALGALELPGLQVEDYDAEDRPPRWLAARVAQQEARNWKYMGSGLFVRVDT
ncbi:hypothetical protein ACRALDRAFT_2098754 [Sodiomyces alcalophilus JCM 7366]|uniref:uncharacterized protein n=1 Tax=Sodiomyces alcalophilus JCM 7366 TaxID=591952 RepID=UPI0039B5694F